MALTDKQGEHLVSLARNTVEDFVTEGRTGDRSPALDGFLRVHRGAFVTLKTVDGALRGCVGVPYPIKPLGDAVVEAAVSAAARDPRFPKVRAPELPGILVEVSALTQPQQLKFGDNRLEIPKAFTVGVDGLIVSTPSASGLLLPQVGKELGVGPEEFLGYTCMKAGLLPDAWLTDHVTISSFQAEIFGESSPRGRAKREG